MGAVKQTMEEVTQELIDSGVPERMAEMFVWDDETPMVLTGAVRMKIVELLMQGKGNVVTGPDQHGSTYVYFQKPTLKVAAKTVPHHDMVNIDYDAFGRLVGIEILGVVKSINPIKGKGRKKQK